MTKLVETIKTLLNLEGQIQLSVNTLQVSNDNEILKTLPVSENFVPAMNLESSIRALVSNFSIIQFCAFLDEYNEFFTPNKCGIEYKERIVKIRKKNDIGIKRIEKWKDLRDFRNMLVAHNFRTNDKISFFSESFVKREFKIPNKIQEKILFAGILQMICKNIIDEFRAEIMLNINPRETMLDYFSIISEDINANEELKELHKIMRK